MNADVIFFLLVGLLAVLLFLAFRHELKRYRAQKARLERLGERLQNLQPPERW
jgi:hypothetical protein